MENRNFVAYEYMSKTVRAKDQSRVIDMYEAFGWEVTETVPALMDAMTVSFKRDRKLPHKSELNRLERKAEDLKAGLDALERSKTARASVFAYLFGCAAALILGGGMCLTMLVEGSFAAFFGGVALGIAGIALCCVNYPIYRRIADRKSREVLPVMDDSEEKLANVLEQANELLAGQAL